MSAQDLDIEARPNTSRSGDSSGIDEREYDDPAALRRVARRRLLPTIATQTVGPPKREALRVMIADDANSTRRFLRSLLEQCRQFEVVGEAIDGEQTVEMARSLQPDVVLLDLSMPLAYGTSALSGVRLAAPKATVIVVSALDPAMEEEVLDAGATAFVPKGVAPIELLACLGEILERSLGKEYRVDPSGVPEDYRAIVFADDPSTLHLVSQVVDRGGVVVTAETGSASNLLEVVNMTQPEIVVLGISLGSTIGTTVISEICRRSPRTAVVVYSAREAWRAEALAAGAIAFIQYPRIHDLAERIQRLALVNRPYRGVAWSRPPKRGSTVGPGRSPEEPQKR
jgi:DNA-binding NarL/FixJ family response regulator